MHVVGRAKKERGKSSACGKSVRDVRKKKKGAACNRLLAGSSHMHV
jgi:hypothetical protein